MVGYTLEMGGWGERGKGKKRGGERDLFLYTNDLKGKFKKRFH